MTSSRSQSTQPSLLQIPPKNILHSLFCKYCVIDIVLLGSSDVGEAQRKRIEKKDAGNDYFDLLWKLPKS